MMKKIYTSILFMAFAFFATAQVSVEFAVDMNDVAEFDPAVNTVRLGGDFQEWNDSATPLADADGNGVYSVVVDDLTPGATLTFKYIIDAWGTNEFIDATAGTCNVEDGGGNVNRQEVIPADATGIYSVPVYKYNTCDISELTANIINPTSTVSGIKITPNPFADRAVLTLDTPVYESHEVNITNINGQVVRTIHGFQGQSLEISRDNLSAGMYFLMLTNQKGEVATSRLMISK